MGRRAALTAGLILAVMVSSSSTAAAIRTPVSLSGLTDSSRQLWSRMTSLPPFQPHPASEAAPVAYKNNKPLIGILSQACHYCPGQSYVAAAYVKWIESAGGRAVPIRLYDSEAELKRLFNAVNGIIFPGGLTDLWLDDPYVISAKKLHDWAVAENNNGTVFPVWGTCLGHQLLQILAANVDFNDLLVETNAVSHASTLKFTEEGKKSRMFGTADPELIKQMEDANKNIIIENHEFGVPPAHFDKWPVLKEQYEIVSTAFDRNGTEYVSTIEHRKYPIFGTQWHPEKPPYEFSDLAIPHSLDAIRVGQHLSNVFIELARQSPHKPESKEEELAMLIYNYKPVFTARDIVMEPSYDGPDNTYFFDPIKEAGVKLAPEAVLSEKRSMEYLRA